MDEKWSGATLAHQSLSGVQGTVSVANQISSFGELETLESRIRMYLFPTRRPRVYPHGKFLVLCSILNSSRIRKLPEVRELILVHITDPYYLHWIKVQYGIKADA